MQHLSGNLFGFFSCRNDRGDGFCIDSFSHNLYRLLISFFSFLFCDGATRVFVRFMSWYALVLHTLGSGSPAVLFDVAASLLQMFCGGRVVKLKLRICTHRVVAVMTSDGVFSGFIPVLFSCFECRVAKQPLSVI